jgi:hypothetical protein
MSPRALGRAAVLGIVALLVALPVTGHYRAKGRVSHYRRALEQKGEKMTLAGIRPVVNPNAVSAGEKLMAAVDRFGNIEEPISNLPAATKIIVPGRAVIRWQQDPLPSYESTNVWPLLTRLLDERRDEMAAIRFAACGPSPTLDVDYSLLWQLPLPHLSRIKRAGELLSASALVELHSGQLSNALASLQALCTLSAPADEPLLWSENFRSRIGETAVSTTWEALQCPGKVFGPVLRGFETNVAAIRSEHPGSVRGIGLMMDNYYSVLDNGGDPAVPSRIGNLKNPTHWWRGCDAVWPGPATQNEAAAYLRAQVNGRTFAGGLTKAVASVVSKVN